MMSFNGTIRLQDRMAIEVLLGIHRPMLLDVSVARVNCPGHICDFASHQIIVIGMARPNCYIRFAHCKIEEIVAQHLTKCSRSTRSTASCPVGSDASSTRAPAPMSRCAHSPCRPVEKPHGLSAPWISHPIAVPWN